MQMTMTKWQLAELLFKHGCPTLTLPDGRAAYVRKVEREDGSGRSFNVYATISNGGVDIVVYVRTTD